MTDPALPHGSSLGDPVVARVLDTLHAEAKNDGWRFARIMPGVAAEGLRERRLDWGMVRRHMTDMVIPVSREQGRLLYLVARQLGARKIVEFGTSLGVSTIYLAAAVKDNGGGIVIGSEMEPTKHARACAHLEQAGLGSLVDVRLGDAQQTLAGIEGPIDMALLDGWKDLYLTVLRTLEPGLRKGAVVLADNIFTFRRALAPYVEYVQCGRHGFQSTTLSIADGFEYSVYLGAAGA